MFGWFQLYGSGQSAQPTDPQAQGEHQNQPSAAAQQLPPLGQSISAVNNNMLSALFNMQSAQNMAASSQHMSPLGNPHLLQNPSGLPSHPMQMVLPMPSSMVQGGLMHSVFDMHHQSGGQLQMPSLSSLAAAGWPSSSPLTAGMGRTGSLLPSLNLGPALHSSGVGAFQGEGGASGGSAAAQAGGSVSSSDSYDEEDDDDVQDGDDTPGAADQSEESGRWAKRRTRGRPRGAKDKQPRVKRIYPNNSLKKGAAKKPSKRQRPVMLSSSTSTASGGQEYSGRRKPWKIVLTAQDALDIYKERTSGRQTAALSSELAERYHVNAKTIRDIWNRESWVKTTRPLWTEEEVNLHKERAQRAHTPEDAEKVDSSSEFSKAEKDTKGTAERDRSGKISELVHSTDEVPSARADDCIEPRDRKASADPASDKGGAASAFQVRQIAAPSASPSSKGDPVLPGERPKSKRGRPPGAKDTKPRRRKAAGRGHADLSGLSQDDYEQSPRRSDEEAHEPSMNPSDPFAADRARRPVVVSSSSRPAISPLDRSSGQRLEMLANISSKAGMHVAPAAAGSWAGGGGADPAGQRFAPVRPTPVRPEVDRHGGSERRDNWARRPAGDNS